MLGFLAPAGSAVPLRNITAGLVASLFEAAPRAALEAALATRCRREHCWTTASGRAAMSLALSALKSMDRSQQRHRVIVPAYTCYSVPAAVQRAGLTPLLCDVDPQTLALDLQSIQHTDCNSVLAIVSSNLYGMPNNLPEIEAFARSRQIFMIDDAAQALGATISGRPAGSFGDIGILSFDKGKNISTMQGGALLTSNADIATAFASLYQMLPEPPAPGTLKLALQCVAYTVLLRPSAYAFIQRMSFLGLGTTQYDIPTPMNRLSQTQSALASRSLAWLPKLEDIRRRNAANYQVAVQSIAGMRTFKACPDAHCVFPRYPVMVEDPATRTAVIQHLQAAGIGATASYPSALPDVPEVGQSHAADSFPGARFVARRIVTLPTHSFCPANVGELAKRAIQDALGSEDC